MDLTRLTNDASCHIVLVVVDGLGGYATRERGSELEEAHTPNLDQLAADGSTGLLQPAGRGITVGSGPGHLALFGYDPLEIELGRGVLSATGVGFDLQPGDVAARANLATLDADGTVVDRRAGRPDNATAQRIVDHLNDAVSLDGVEVFFELIAEHRVLLVVRGDGLDHRLADVDPQRTGVPPRDPQPLDPAAEDTAQLMRDVLAQVRDALTDHPADALLPRGFDTAHELPSFADRYRLRAATVAIYPMYRGVARLCGMTAIGDPHSKEEQVAAIRDHWDEFDYFFLHEKEADRAGHDGDWDDKVAALEAFDEIVPALVDLQPDVLVVTGDHSSPTQLADHSWHPVPVVMWGPRVGVDDVDRFGERACSRGILGQLPTQDLMPLMLAAADKLETFGV
ncbi:MAG: 2,3-bisphosphoglycerate-independent phosphoglycerate mutase [Nitriliruptorales bacterium]|nr:2,3-bisphosphoglycerate-independent phosphoglycerate mutase [Nitriliruptorales bacterium]